MIFSSTLLDQALVNDIHTIQPSVNGINEVGQYLKKEAEPPFAIHIQKELDGLNAQWENVCKQVRDLNPERAFILLFFFSFPVMQSILFLFRSRRTQRSRPLRAAWIRPWL